jgi:hypothetical protein
MKLFVNDNEVFFLKNKILHKTSLNSYNFCDLEEGEVVRCSDPKEQDQFLRIWTILMPHPKVAQDAEQLVLF